MRWKIRVATYQKWLPRDARVGTLAKEVNLLENVDKENSFAINQPLRLIFFIWEE